MKPGAAISGIAAATAALITGYVRDEEKGHPRIGALSLALVTLLVGHFEGH